MRSINPLKTSDRVKRIGIYSWSIIGILILVALAFYIIYRIRVAFLLVIIAAGLSYLLSPVVDWLGKKMKRGWAIFIAYLIFTGLVFVLFFFGVPMIIDQFQVFIESFPSYIENLTGLINNFILNNRFVGNIEEMIGGRFAPLDAATITSYITNVLSLSNINFLQRITSFTQSIVSFFIIIILGPLLGIYILKDSGRLRNVFTRAMPGRFKRQASDIIDIINNVGGRYIRGQILVAIIVGLLCTLVLVILKVDFAILLGLIAGFFNLIPWLGPIIGIIPAALAALFVSPLTALIVILAYIGIQQLDNYFISPNIMKMQVGLHPALVIVFIIIAGAAFGLLGMLVVVPIAATVQAIMKYYLFDRKTGHHGKSP